MAERLLLLVITFQAFACAPDFPRDLYIDDRFDAAEEADIVAMVGEMNKMGQELLGRDLVAYRGRHQDADGWNLDNADDGTNMIYKVMREDANYDYIASKGGLPGYDDAYVAGLGLNHDILIYAFTMGFSRFNGRSYEWCIAPFMYERFKRAEAEAIARGETVDYSVDDWATVSDDCPALGYTLSGQGLQAVALHEMGHFVGMSHINDREAVMYPVESGATAFADNDKRSFCCRFECITDAFECDWNLTKQVFPPPDPDPDAASGKDIDAIPSDPDAQSDSE